MVVIVLEKVSDSIKGELSRYLLEVKSGVFIGNINANVTEILWGKITDDLGKGNAILIRSNASEQGYFIRSAGSSRKIINDFDGLSLITKLPNNPKM